MGVTNRLKPVDVASVCKVTTDLEDTPDSLGLADIDHFAPFVRGTQVPPRNAAVAQTSDAITGQNLFTSVGCAICHVPTMTTDRAGTLLNGGTYTVPAALGSKIFHPYGDSCCMMWERETALCKAALQTLPTSCARGLQIKARFMHDNASATLSNAIARHAGEATQVIANSTL
jgi:CxxC motif-containing protein (DUF1111 family)